MSGLAAPSAVPGTESLSVGCMRSVLHLEILTSGIWAGERASFLLLLFFLNCGEIYIT